MPKKGAEKEGDDDTVKPLPLLLLIFVITLYLTFLFVREWILLVPVIITPKDGFVVDPDDLKFYWNPITNREATYEIHVDNKSKKFKSIVAEGTTDDVIFLPKLIEDHTYFFRLRSIVDGTPNRWSKTIKFSTDKKHVQLGRVTVKADKNCGTGAIDMPDIWDCFVKRNGRWRISGDTLVGWFDDLGWLYAPGYSGDIAIEFDAYIENKDSKGLSVLIGSGGDRKRGYYVGLAHGAANEAEIHRNYESVADQKIGLRYNRWYRIGVGRRGDVIAVYLDGEKVLEYEDPEPLDDETFNELSFGVYDSQARFKNIRVFRPDESTTQGFSPPDPTLSFCNETWEGTTGFFRCWKIRNGSFTVENEILTGSSEELGWVQTHALSKDVEVSFSVRLNESAQKGFSVLLNALKDRKEGYYLAFSHDSDDSIRLHRNYDVVGKSDFVFEYGRWYDVEVIRKDNVLWVRVEGKIVLEFVDSDPVIDERFNLVALGVYRSSIEFANLSIRRPVSAPIARPRGECNDMWEGAADFFSCWTRRGGDWWISEDTLTGYSDGLGWVWMTGPEGDVGVEFDVVLDRKDGRGVSVLLNSLGSRKKGYYLALNHDTRNVIELHKDYKGVKTAGYILQYDTPYKIRVERVGKKLYCYVDGQLVLEYTDPKPTKGGRNREVGLGVYRSQARFTNIRVYHPTTSRPSGTKAPKRDVLCGKTWEGVDGLMECWRVIDGSWWIEGGELLGVADGLGWVGMHSTPKDVEVEFMFRSENPEGPSVSILLNGLRDRSLGYYLAVNHAGNDVIELHKNFEVVARQNVKLDPGRWYRIRAVRHENMIEVYLGNEKMMEYEDPNPLNDPEYDEVWLGVYQTRARFRGIKVKTPSETIWERILK